MNWPAPTLLPPPDTGHPPPDALRSHSDPESESDRRRLSAIPAATWVALIGGALVLLAAAIVVVSNWDTIGRSFRFAGFAAVTVILIWAGERLRPSVPTSAGSIAHVGAFLTGGIGIAGLSLFGVTWPTCLLVGGAIVAGATEVQATRWRTRTFLLGQIAGLSIAATGVADLTGTTGGLVAVGVAVGLLTVGAQRRAAVMALLAVLSPALTALAAAGIGPGTFERAGLVGERLSWSGPIVGIAAAMVLGIVASQRRNNGLMLMAAVSPIVGLVTGLSAIDGSEVAWLAVPALTVIALELAWWSLPADRFRAQIGDATAGVGIVVAIIGWAAPVIVSSTPFGTSMEHPWAIPSALTAVALALVTMRLRSADHPLTVLALTGVVTTTLGLVIALGAPAALIGVAAVVLVPLGAYFSRQVHPLIVHLPAAWAVMAILDIDDAASAAHLDLSIALLAMLVVVVTALRTRLSFANHWFGWMEMSLVTVVASTAATSFAPDNIGTVSLAAAALTIALINLIERRYTVWALAALVVAGIASADAATSTVLADSYWLGWSIATLSLTALWIAHRNRLVAHAATAAAVITAATATVLLDVTAEQFIGLSMLATVGLTGVVLALQRRSPLDAAAAAAGATMLFASAFDVDAAWVSAIWVVLGLQIVCAGAAFGAAAFGAGAGAVEAAVRAGAAPFTSPGAGSGRVMIQLTNAPMTMKATRPMKAPCMKLQLPSNQSNTAASTPTAAATPQLPRNSSVFAFLLSIRGPHPGYFKNNASYLPSFFSLWENSVSPPSGRMRACATQSSRLTRPLKPSRFSSTQAISGAVQAAIWSK